jgi:NADH dehydrogenase
MNENIVILGGGYAGAMAAARIARRGIPVTLIDAKDGLVERIRLHQVVAGDEVPPVPYARLFRNLPVQFIRARATALDRTRKRVITTEGEIAYDKLVYAIGSESEMSDPFAIRRALADAKRVAIVGAGLTGIELAGELAERHPHLELTLFDAGTLGQRLSSKAAKHLRNWMHEHRVRVIENTVVESTDADLTIWCGSFRLSPIAREAGLRVNERGQIIVDEHLRSSDPSIHAVGDAAARGDLRMSCAVALPMGTYVADLLTGATREPFRFAFVIQCISLGRKDGIIQFVNADDTPREKCLTGRPAAWIKELICRYTVTSLRLQSRGFFQEAA